MDQCDIPDTFLTPCFLTRGHKLNSLVHSLPQLLFSVTPIFARVIFSNPKINSVHISYMYERCSTAHEMKKSPCCWEEMHKMQQRRALRKNVATAQSIT